MQIMVGISGPKWKTDIGESESMSLDEDIYIYEDIYMRIYI